MSRRVFFFVASFSALLATGCPLSDDYSIVPNGTANSAGQTTTGGSGARGGETNQAGQSGSGGSAGSAGRPQGGSAGAGASGGDGTTGGSGGSLSQGGASGSAGAGGIAGDAGQGGVAGDAGAGGVGGDAGVGGEGGTAGTAGDGAGGTSAGASGTGGAPYCLEGWASSTCGPFCSNETGADRKCIDLLNCYVANRCGPNICDGTGEPCVPSNFGANQSAISIAKNVYDCRCPE